VRVVVVWVVEWLILRPNPQFPLDTVCQDRYCIEVSVLLQVFADFRSRVLEFVGCFRFTEQTNIEFFRSFRRDSREREVRDPSVFRPLRRVLDRLRAERMAESAKHGVDEMVLDEAFRFLPELPTLQIHTVSRYRLEM